MGFVSIVRRFRFVLYIVGCFAVATGCYSYQPIAPASVAPGATVRAHLTGEGMLRLEDIFGEPRRTVEGEVIQADDSRLLLLSSTGMSAGLAAPSLKQRIIIQEQEIIGIEQRRLERARTAAFTAILTTGLAALVVYFFRGGSSGRPPAEPAPGPEMQIVPGPEI